MASSQSTANNELQYTGSAKDSKSGLNYMNSRFYEPTTGRFLSQDTYKGNAYSPMPQHLYSYCGNNPTNFIDPTGHMRDERGGACKPKISYADYLRLKYEQERRIAEYQAANAGRKPVLQDPKPSIKPKPSAKPKKGNLKTPEKQRGDFTPTQEWVDKFVNERKEAAYTLLNELEGKIDGISVDIEDLKRVCDSYDGEIIFQQVSADNYVKYYRNTAGFQRDTMPADYAIAFTYRYNPNDVLTQKGFLLNSKTGEVLPDEFNFLNKTLIGTNGGNIIDRVASYRSLYQIIISTI